MIRLFLIMALSLLPLVTSANKKANQRLFENISNNVITPQYKQLDDSTKQLAKTLEQCRNGEDLTGVKVHWGKTMDTWQNVQWIKFGPIKEESREWQLQFWPDTKNLTGRKVNQLLQKTDVSKIDVKKSGLIVQGLPALEYILFDNKAASIANTQQRCHLAAIIAESLELLTSTLRQEWSTYSDEYIQQFSSVSNAEFEEDFLILLINSLVQQLDLIVDKKIATPYGFGGRARSNAYFLESWRSEHSLSNIYSNLDAIKMILDQGGLNQYLYDKGHGNLALTIADQIKSLTRLQSTPLKLSFTNLSAEHKQSIVDAERLYREFVKLRRLIKVDLVKALNIRLSFNASDGDS